MFIKQSFQQMKKQKSKTIMIIIGIILGSALIFSSNVMSDTVQSGLSARFSSIYGGIDYTVYRTDGLFTDNRSITIPQSILSTIKASNHVLHAVSRLGAQNGFYETANDEQFSAYVASINQTDPDERFIGISKIIDCMPIFGNPNDTVLEDLLNTSIIQYPVVISKLVSDHYDLNTGDNLLIRPMNATNIYATIDEIASVKNGTVDSEDLETDLQDNKTRWNEFTITGIMVDGSEGLEKPTPHKSNSLYTISAKDESLYIPLSVSLSHVFNNKTEVIASYFMIEVDDDFVPEDFLSNLKSVEPSISFGIFDLYYFIGQYTDYIMMIMRIAFSMIGSITLLVCCYLVKGLVDISVFEQIKVIGILKLQGFKDRSVTEIFLPQIIFLSIVGTAIGMEIGYFIGQTIDVSISYTFLSYNYEYVTIINVETVLSALTIGLTILVGIIVPIIFALYPLIKMKQWSFLEMINPVVKEEMDNYGIVKDKKKNTFKLERFSLKNAISPVIIIILSQIGIWVGITQMFPDQYIHITAGDQYAYLALLFLSAIFFFIGIVSFFQGGLGVIGSLFTRGRLGKKYLKGLRRYTQQSIYINARKNKNLMSFMAVIFAVLVLMTSMLGTIFNSSRINRTELGGDVVIFQPFVSSNMIDSIINQVDGVEAATLYGFLTMENKDYNKQEYASMIVNQINGWGGKHDNETQALNVLVIDVEGYITLNQGESSSFIDKPVFTDFQSFVRKLNEPSTTIIDSRLASDLNLDIDQKVNVSLNGFDIELKIVGIAKQMPAMPFSNMRDSDDDLNGNSYRHRGLIISRQTFASSVSEFAANVDIMIKNSTIDYQISGQSISDDFAGYLSARIDRVTIDSVLSNVTGISQVSHRFSTFAPTFPIIQAKNITNASILYKTDDEMIVDQDMNVTSRLYVFNPAEEIGMTSESEVLETMPWISSTLFDGYDGTRVYNRTASEIMYFLDSIITESPYDAWRSDILMNNSYCIVNKYAATIDDDGIAYVYENHAGDVFNITFEDGSDTYSMPYQVVATIDNHIPYYYNNGSDRSDYALSGKTLNYDSSISNEEMKTSSFWDIFDVDANVVFTSYEELGYMQSKITGLPSQFYNVSLMNHLYISVDDGANVTVVIENINNELQTRGILNISVCALKSLLVEKVSNMGCLAIKKITGYDDEQIALNLRNWFVSNNLTWYESAVGYVSRYKSETDMIGPILDVVVMNFTICIIIASLGLALSIYAVMSMRHKEFGILKSQGFSPMSIGRLAFLESFVVGFTGALIGVFSGYGVSSEIFYIINSIIVRPIEMLMPIVQIVITAILLLAIQLTMSSVISNRITNISIAENMRNLG